MATRTDPASAATPDGDAAVDPGAIEPMDVVVTMQHPAHVHFFKHAIRRLEDGGHTVHVFARDKAVTADLLEAYDIDHELLAGAAPGSLPGLARTQLTYEVRLLRRALAIRPNVMAAIGGVAVSHVAALVGARSVVFTDTEHADLINRLAFPVADRVVTPTCFHESVDGDHRTYPGYHELAYLHPDRFEPDPSVPRDLGLDPDERFVVLRVISWDASHDVDASGFDSVREVVERLEATGARVLVAAEGDDVPPAVADRQVSVEPHRMHDLLAYADLFVGEGATMAAESAVLGTPAVYVNTLRMGYTDELEARYGLLVNCQGAFRHQRALEVAERLLDDEATDWAARRERLLTESVDTTETVLEVLLDGGRD
ncbi:DUF354 domain-containing protein [Halorarius litoreus]|uniref:DUF354 domain-containing protein n=1 Tax=Halorarius litoreus TaxID=2962676 RepID=UPI0020CDD7FE|nr:DUF354 domain-containing protein [Halorarius litoreus]